MATVLFSIDGLRPDALQQAETPTIDRLIANGSSTMQARTVMPSVTLPCHTSMLRGVDVPRHGITSNTFAPLARPVPSVIDAAKRAGLRTGFFYNWGELRDLCEPGSLDVGYFVQDAHRPEGDWAVTHAAISHQTARPFDFLFVYLGWTDECGHLHGWMSEEYLAAVENADECVAAVLESLPSDVNVLLQSDHGGHGRSHGTDMDEDMLIPWILSGLAAKTGHVIESEVRIFDTCVTLASIMGLPLAREWEGRVITEALQ